MDSKVISIILELMGKIPKGRNNYMKQRLSFGHVARRLACLHMTVSLLFCLFLPPFACVFACVCLFVSLCMCVSVHSMGWEFHPLLGDMLSKCWLTPLEWQKGPAPQTPMFPSPVFLSSYAPACTTLSWVYCEHSSKDDASMVPSHLHVVMSSSPVRSCSSVCMELDILRYHKLYVLHPVFPSVFVHYVALADLELTL